MQTDERGFTLAEVVIGAAVAAFVVWSLVAGASRYAGAAAAMNQRLISENTVGRLFERLTSESTSAWAVYVPASDVLGESNADGHEVDFFAEDGAHRPYGWAYRYDARTKALIRYADAPGAPPQAGETLGSFDAFTASAYDITAMSDAASDVYDPLFAGASASPVRYRFTAMPGAVGGNGIVRIDATADGFAHTALLSSATAPTSFTVVETFTPPPAVASATPAPLPTLTPTP